VIRCYESFVPAPTVLHPLCLKDTESLGRGEKSFENLDVRPGSRLSGNL
jgi:hypothetical protein